MAADCNPSRTTADPLQVGLKIFRNQTFLRVFSPLHPLVSSKERLHTQKKKKKIKQKKEGINPENEFTFYSWEES